METIDTKTRVRNRIFYTILTLLIIGSVGVTFYKIVIQKNYQITAETSCDPQAEKCFIRTCDPANDDTCPTNKEEQTTYYKLVSKRASNVAVCGATVEKTGCDTELSCTQGELNCSYTFCTESNVPDGETCSSPTQ